MNCYKIKSINLLHKQKTLQNNSYSPWPICIIKFHFQHDLITFSFSRCGPCPLHSRHEATWRVQMVIKKSWNLKFIIQIGYGQWFYFVKKISCFKKKWVYFITLSQKFSFVYIHKTTKSSLSLQDASQLFSYYPFWNPQR